MEKILLILCGGTGSRLGAITKRVPKPLIKINGNVFLEHLIEGYSPFFDRIILLAGYMGNRFKRFEGRTVSVVLEQKTLGTGGAVLNILDKIPEGFFLCNGDTFLDRFDVEAFLGFCSKEGSSLLLSRGEMHAKGSVQIKGKKITGFMEKQARGPGLVYGGFASLKKEDLKEWRGGDVEISMEKKIFPVLAKKGKLAGYVSDSKIYDIGTSAGIRKFKELYSESK